MFHKTFFYAAKTTSILYQDMTDLTSISLKKICGLFNYELLSNYFKSTNFLYHLFHKNHIISRKEKISF